MDNEQNTPGRKTDAEAPAPEHVHIPNDDTVITEDPAQNEDVNEAQSSGAEDVETKPETEPQSMLEAVEKELEGVSSDPGTEAKAGEEEAKAAPDPETEEDEGKSDDLEYLNEDPSDDEVKDYSKKAQARIRQLVEQRNEATGRTKELEPVLEFLDKNDIPQKDLDVILDLTARLRHGDFAGFLNGVQPYVNLAMQYTGQSLPGDLQKQVSDGYVSPEAAAELAQRRIQAQMHQQDIQNRDARDVQQNTRQKAETIRQAVSRWEQQQHSSDPDYGLKADMIRRSAQAMMQEKGVPETVDQALTYVKDAYAEVNEQLGKLRPQRQPTQNRPNGSVTKGGTAPRTTPTSMMEAAMQGLQSARGG